MLPGRRMFEEELGARNSNIGHHGSYAETPSRSGRNDNKTSCTVGNALNPRSRPSTCGESRHVPAFDDAPFRPANSQ